MHALEEDSESEEDAEEDESQGRGGGGRGGGRGGGVLTLPDDAQVTSGGATAK